MDRAPQTTPALQGRLGADGPETVGDGGEGLVFQATCEIEGEERQVALKMHTAVPARDYARIVARARVLSVIDHPNVMHVRDAFIGSALTESPDPTARMPGSSTPSPTGSRAVRSMKR